MSAARKRADAPGAPPTGAPLVVNGWSLFVHPLFIQQLEALTAQVAELQRKEPKGYQQKNATKRLAAIRQLAFEVIPQDPTRPEHRQGNTLGDGNKHWLRAKFFQPVSRSHRLFFRFHAPSQTIVYVWVNDENSKRAYESHTDTCRVFARMLASGHPPGDWAALLSASRATPP